MEHVGFMCVQIYQSFVLASFVQNFRAQKFRDVGDELEIYSKQTNKKINLLVILENEICSHPKKLDLMNAYENCIKLDNFLRL